MCTNPPAAAALSRRPFSKNVVIPFIYNKYLLLLSFSRFSALHSQKAEKKKTHIIHSLAVLIVLHIIVGTAACRAYRRTYTRENTQ